MLVVIVFQYPPCGSSRCNPEARIESDDTKKFFQYPPCGSSRCNKGKLEHKRNIDVSFSTLHAGRVAATRASVMAAHSPCLSVPSMRVESLQHQATVHLDDKCTDFQYPPCGSSRCNPTWLC